MISTGPLGVSGLWHSSFVTVFCEKMGVLDNPAWPERDSTYQHSELYIADLVESPPHTSTRRNWGCSCAAAPSNHLHGYKYRVVTFDQLGWQHLPCWVFRTSYSIRVCSIQIENMQAPQTVDGSQSQRHLQLSGTVDPCSPRHSHIRSFHRHGAYQRPCHGRHSQSPYTP